MFGRIPNSLLENIFTVYLQYKKIILAERIFCSQMWMQSYCSRYNLTTEKSTKVFKNLSKRKRNISFAKVVYKARPLTTFLLQIITPVELETHTEPEQSELCTAFAKPFFSKHYVLARSSFITQRLFEICQRRSRTNGIVFCAQQKEATGEYSEPCQTQKMHLSVKIVNS